MTTSWLIPNARAGLHRPYEAAQRAVLTAEPVAALAASLERCPAHRVTPLLKLSAQAARLGIESLSVKDEAQRFGFGTFKALGGVNAVHAHLAARYTAAGHPTPDFAALMTDTARAVTGDVVFTTASSGNHGRSVAAGARLLGHRSVIFLPAFASIAKEDAIRARGAEVVRVECDYEAAVERCRLAARDNGWVVISDTSWEGYTQTPRDVMQGYCVLAYEALQQCAAAHQPVPSHVFVQAGVGGLAAAVIGYFWQTLGASRPAMIVVEPQSADCWFQSNIAGRPVLASGNAQTMMGGLACREISPLAWPIVGEGADWFMTIAEDEVAPAMRLLARPQPGDPVIVAGPSGCSGMAALLRVAADDAARAAVGLSSASRVMLINSEGADGEPELFERATGMIPAAAKAMMRVTDETA